MKLKEILKEVEILEIHGSEDRMLSNLAFDSRKLVADSLFVALKGTQVDGHDFIDAAVEKGASVLVVQDEITNTQANLTYIRVQDTSKALGTMAANFYHHPSTRIQLVGVTGTNGKTTIATLLHQLFQDLGYPCGLISTIQNRIENTSFPTSHTTPDVLAINQLLARMVEQGCTHCFMEVSSHAVVQNRIHGLHFKGGIFSNITHEHLDYHGNFQEYIKAKQLFFTQLSPEAFALSNLDDPNARLMLQNTKAAQYYYSLLHPADFKGKILESQLDAMLLEIQLQSVWFRLSGKFNAYNLLAIFGSARLLGISAIVLLPAMSRLQAAEGRFDVVTAASGVKAIIDYAHTPDALKNVLSTISALMPDGAKIITVVGAGGNRDKSKRPVMTQVCLQFSQQLILTSDNPRNEDPQDILDDMLDGIPTSERKKILCILNRKEAIKTAYAMATAGDVILVAGKGHEKYQEIQGVKHPFDDKQILLDLITN